MVPQKTPIDNYRLDCGRMDRFRAVHSPCVWLPRSFSPRIYRLETINPFRDTRPEWASEKLLRDLSAGKCSPDDFCRSLRISHPVTAWRLVARQNQDKDGAATVHLYYWIKSIEGSNTLIGQVEVTMKRDGSGWKPSNFVALY